jgi:L-arabinose transport system substrate-binding protein
MEQVLSRWSRLVAVVVAAGLTACVQQPPTNEAPPPTPAAKAGPVAKAGPAATAPDKAGGPIVLGFLVKQPEEKWFQDEWKFARKCADKYGFKLVEIGATDGEKVLSAIDNLAAQGAQGFVICTPDVKLGPSIVAKAQQKNMKVLSVDDQFVGGDGKFMDVPYMGISASDIGEQMGKGLAAELKKRGWTPQDTAAAGITWEQLDTSKNRTDGAIRALTAAGFPRDRIFTEPEKTTDVEGSLNAMNIMLTKHQDVKHWLVFSMNDEGVLGAVRALEGRGFKKADICGIGIGGSSCFSELEKDTGFFGTVLISPLRHGFETTELLYKWVKDGVAPPKATLTKGILVDRSNFKKVATEQGLM